MWEADLIRLIQECHTMNEQQRFGQLIYNMVAQPGESQEDFHTKLFYLTDEDFVAIIKAWFEGNNQTD
jgi:hypothetical protein